MRIGIISDTGNNNTAYRAFPVAELTGLGHDVALYKDARSADVVRLARCDVVHVYRYTAPPIRDLVRRLKEMGVAVVWDVDDDLGAAPDAMPGRYARGAVREQKLLRDAMTMARLADLMTTTSEPIAEAYRSRGVAAVRVVENYLPKLYTSAPPRPHDGVVIGWVAAGEHLHDVEHLRLREVLSEVLARDAATRVHTIGVPIDLPSDRYRRDIGVHYQDLGSRIAEWDIAIAPLDDIPFNRARSNVKLKEYAFAGVPWLASPVGPYATFGEQQGGRLVPADGWTDALLSLAGNPRARRKLGKRGRRWARGQTAANNLGVWEAAMAEAVERARHRGG
jgi:glycosyltransferase involved in cell wall biosynthesis